MEVKDTPLLRSQESQQVPEVPDSSRESMDATLIEIQRYRENITSVNSSTEPKNLFIKIAIPGSNVITTHNIDISDSFKRSKELKKETSLDTHKSKAVNRYNLRQTISSADERD
jgi:hypothetical protein